MPSTFLVLRPCCMHRRSGLPLTCGVPFPRGELKSPDELDFLKPPDFHLLVGAAPCGRPIWGACRGAPLQPAKVAEQAVTDRARCSRPAQQHYPRQQYQDAGKARPGQPLAQNRRAKHHRKHHAEIAHRRKIRHLRHRQRPEQQQIREQR